MKKAEEIWDLHSRAIPEDTYDLEQAYSVVAGKSIMFEDDFKQGYESAISEFKFLLEYLLEHDDGVGICLGYQSREMIESLLKNTPCKL